MPAGPAEMRRINADHLAEEASRHSVASGGNVTLLAQSVRLYVVAC